MTKFSENESETHTCSKSIELVLKLQKANDAIKALQLKHKEKMTEINRIRSSLRRTQLRNSNFQAILKEIKNKKMISEEGVRILKVKIKT